MSMTERRIPRQTISQLENEVSDLADVLRNLFVAEFDATNPTEIQQNSTAITTAKNNFDLKSRLIEERYKEYGSISNSRNAKRLRLELSREFYSSIKDLNEHRQLLNMEIQAPGNPNYQKSLVSVVTQRPIICNNEGENQDNENHVPYDDGQNAEGPIVTPAPGRNNWGAPSPLHVFDDTPPSPPHVHNEDIQPDSDPAITHGSGIQHVQESSTASFLIKSELLKTPPNPFDGSPGTYHMWSNLLNGRMSCVKLNGIEKLQVLCANTSGRPQELIRDYLSNVTPLSANSALEIVMTTLEERYGNKLASAQVLIDRIKKLPVIKSVEDEGPITQMLDACRNAVCSMASSPQLDWLNSYEGLQMITKKLPDNLLSRWRTYGVRIKSGSGRNPNLSVFVGYLQILYRESVDDFFKREKSSTSASLPPTTAPHRYQKRVQVFRTAGISSDENSGNKSYCYVHKTGNHDLKDCKVFAKFDKNKKVEIVKNNKLCFRCLFKHFVKDCNAVTPKCDICGQSHLTCMHYERSFKRDNIEDKNIEKVSDDSKFHNLNTEAAKCIRTDTGPTSNDNVVFSKTFIVEVTHAASDKVVKCTAILDDQSTRCFADEKLLKILNVNAPNHSYSVETLSGLKTNIKGQLVSDLKIRGVKNGSWYSLPHALTYPTIPDTRHEMATPELIENFPHLKHLSSKFLSLSDDVEPLLLLGADAGELMNCITHGAHAPYVQETPIGFALVGPVPKHALNGISLRFPIPTLHVLRIGAASVGHTSLIVSDTFEPKIFNSKIDVFERHADDELKGISADESKFLEKVSSKIEVSNDNQLILPLPFKSDDPFLPNNKDAVYFRTSSTLAKLKNDKNKLEQCCASIDKNLKLGHVEQVPCSELSSYQPGKSWWLPVFPVTHPQKGTARLVFDASASYSNVSLNDMLLQGPDLNNDLRAVLLRFRIFPIAFTCDIKHMFLNFLVPKEQRDFLRFFWWQDNDPLKPIIQYRSKAHLFGARSSPSIAEFGLKFVIKQGLKSNSISESTANFVNSNFYVDDGLHSCSSVADAIKMIEETKQVLSNYNLELHKISSNSKKVESNFQSQDNAPTNEVQLNPSIMQRALGVVWDTSLDVLSITINVIDRPYTRRGLLSEINSLFDPIGMVAPIVLGGRIVQREAMNSESGNASSWDAPLPQNMRLAWENWKSTLRGVKVSIPRCILPKTPEFIELHVFADASSVAIGYVIYAVSKTNEVERNVSFVIGGSKVAPKGATTIPRLELCAALEASIASSNVVREMKVKISNVFCYTDSMITLGYLKNSQKAFSRYVSRRVENIKYYSPRGASWNYVATDENPADHATRPTDPVALVKSNWFNGPAFLKTDNPATLEAAATPYGNLPEAVNPPKVFRTDEANVRSPLIGMLKRVSNWRKCVKITQLILSFSTKLLDRAQQRLGKSLAPRNTHIGLKVAESILISASQRESFPEAFDSSGFLQQLPENHVLIGLTIFQDSFGLIRAGGRIKNSLCSFATKHPVILSNKHPIAEKIARSYHESCAHQGRLISYATVRQNGYFILKGKRLMNNLIASCVLCKKMRGNVSNQLMADLPEERVTPSAPFDHIGIDVFGPFLVHDGQNTRRSKATKKMYGLMITCLSSRAVHVEALPGLDTASFLNAMRRFFVIRGRSKTIRSDNGTNFVGALSASLDFSKVVQDVEGGGCKWIMNPPGASHFGGVYERKIGSVRRILESFFIDRSQSNLSRDEMATLIQEAVGIINDTPMYGISDDPSDPYPITPSMILTLKGGAQVSTSDETSETDLMSYGKNRWKRVQHLAEEFWREWHKHYLSQLVERRKWKSPKQQIKVGDVVLIRTKNVPRNQWNLGLVCNTVAGKDGFVRRVLVKVAPIKGKSRTVEKAIHDLVVICPKS